MLPEVADRSRSLAAAPPDQLQNSKTSLLPFPVAEDKLRSETGSVPDETQSSNKNPVPGETPTGPFLIQARCMST